MKDIKAKKKELKRAYKKQKRKHVLLWKILSIVLVLVLILASAVNIPLSMFDNTIGIYTGGGFWRLVNEDPSAVRYTSDFSSPAELAAYGLELCQQVEAEGAVLLMNENNALPLAAGAKVSCFSNSTVNPIYGGTGSGNVDASQADSLKTALEKSGLQVNDTLWSFYETGPGSQYARVVGGLFSSAKTSVGEVPWDAYTGDVLGSVSSYGDAAVVMISRVGGEGADLDCVDSNYLALDPNEMDMLSALADMKADGTVSRIVLLINSSNPLQVDFLKDNLYDIDAALWIGGVGISGMNAVADILAGHVTPSGSLVDTYCYDNYSAPAMQNFTPQRYSGAEEGALDGNSRSYVVYQEGIYVGYKYYETRYEDAVMGTGNAGNYAYGGEVAYPFGYGLSYTDFEVSGVKGSYNADQDQFEITATVTNTGSTYSGKKTVQVYVQSPYTNYDKQNGVEKASVALCGFAKTQLLAPGASETVTVYVDRSDIASYDVHGAGTYILDAGDYYLTVADNAHAAVNNVLAAKGYTTADGMDADGSADLTWKWTNPTLDATTYSVSANGTPIVNRLSNADLNLYEGSDTTVTYLSRSDWAGTFPQGPVELMATPQIVADLGVIQYDPADHDPADMPTLGAKNGMKLYDMIGLDYNDPQWEPLLDQLTFEEMVSLVTDSFHWTMPVKSVEAPGTRDENGPQGLTSSLFSTAIDATAFTSEDVMAATFNVELLTEIGRVIGNDCLNTGVAILYGPGNNIHRTPYSGRNFEYYSEDGFLSGKLSAYEVAAIEAKGVHVVMKHYAFNDNEADRIGLGVWSNEQAGREIYLKAFQDSFEEGNANGVMTSYTRLGTTWCGGNAGLVNGILRDEWGCQGLIISDNATSAYMNGPDAVMAGSSTFDAMVPMISEGQLRQYKNDPVIVSAMREACHHNLFAVTHSMGMNGVGPNTTIALRAPTVIAIVRNVVAISAILLTACGLLWLRGVLNLRKTEEYQNYKRLKKQKSAS